MCIGCFNNDELFTYNLDDKSVFHGRLCLIILTCIAEVSNCVEANLSEGHVGFSARTCREVILFYRLL